MFVGGVSPRGGGNRKVINAPGIPGGERTGADKSNHIKTDILPIPVVLIQLWDTIWMNNAHSFKKMKL